MGFTSGVGFVIWLLAPYLIIALVLWVEMARYVGGQDADGSPRWGISREDAPLRLAGVGFALYLIAVAWIVWFPLVLAMFGLGKLVQWVMPLHRPTAASDPFVDD